MTLPQVASALGFIGAIGIAATPMIALVKYINNKVTNTTITQRFVHDMATNHLPHIYHVQTLMCNRMGIEVTEPQPNINFIDLDSKEQGK